MTQKGGEGREDRVRDRDSDHASASGQFKQDRIVQGEYSTGHRTLLRADTAGCEAERHWERGGRESPREGGTTAQDRTAMKSIRRSLKDRERDKDRQSPPSTGGSYHTATSHSHSQHHILSNGSGSTLGAVLPPVAAPRGGMHGKTPPKKVIRAIASYRSQSPQELSFESGDFFHVMGERVAEGEVEWFDAANPLTGARGLVPARCFQILGRNEKENAAVQVAQHTRNGSMHSSAATLSPPLGGVGGSGSGSGSHSQGHPSSQFQQQQQYGQQRSNNSSSSTSLSRQSAGSNGTVPSPSSGSFPGGTGGSSRLSKPSSATTTMTATGSGSRAKTQPLYGVVQYDFVAERADELDAKKGESIIVIAQSNHEWFVAKPIGRLGGPGLIPVSFVAISDTTTGGWPSSPLLAGEVSPVPHHRLG